MTRGVYTIQSRWCQKGFSSGPRMMKPLVGHHNDGVGSYNLPVGINDGAKVLVEGEGLAPGGLLDARTSQAPLLLLHLYPEVGGEVLDLFEVVDRVALRVLEAS